MDPPQLSPLQDPTLKTGGHLLTAAQFTASWTVAGELKRWDLCGCSRSLPDDLSILQWKRKKMQRSLTLPLPGTPILQNKKDAIIDLRISRFWIIFGLSGNKTAARWPGGTSASIHVFNNRPFQGGRIPGWEEGRTPGQVSRPSQVCHRQSRFRWFTGLNSPGTRSNWMLTKINRNEMRATWQQTGTRDIRLTLRLILWPFFQLLSSPAGAVKAEWRKQLFHVHALVALTFVEVPGVVWFSFGSSAPLWSSQFLMPFLHLATIIWALTPLFHASLTFLYISGSSASSDPV